MRYPSRIRDGLGFGGFSAPGLVTLTWKSFALIALRLPKVCDRSHKNHSKVFGGAVTRLAAPSFNPVRPIHCCSGR
jgi:hypothetical protein